jgi:hypothetical protein
LSLNGSGTSVYDMATGSVKCGPIEMVAMTLSEAQG